MMKTNIRTWSAALWLVAGLGWAGCESAPEHSRPHATAQAGAVRSSSQRIYNPQTRNFEWVTPGAPPTSAGTIASTRGQSFY